MKVRDLVEILKSVDDAEDEVTQAKVSCNYGGSPETRARKQRELDDAYINLERKLDEDIDFS